MMKAMTVTAPGPRDRHAYLEEQIERQKRGEPIDVDWVRAELERVNQESRAKVGASERRLRGLVVVMAVLFGGFWIAGNVVQHNDPKLLAPIGLLVALARSSGPPRNPPAWSSRRRSARPSCWGRPRERRSTSSP